MRNEEKEMADRMIQIMNKILVKLNNYHGYGEIKQYCQYIKDKISKEKHANG